MSSHVLACQAILSCAFAPRFIVGRGQQLPPWEKRKASFLPQRFNRPRSEPLALGLVKGSHLEVALLVDDLGVEPVER